MFQIVTELESMEKGDLGPRLQFALESDDLYKNGRVTQSNSTLKAGCHVPKWNEWQWAK
jgi:hypothetical protein